MPTRRAVVDRKLSYAWPVIMLHLSAISHRGFRRSAGLGVKNSCLPGQILLYRDSLFCCVRGVWRGCAVMFTSLSRGAPRLGVSQAAPDSHFRGSQNFGCF